MFLTEESDDTKIPDVVEHIESDDLVTVHRAESEKELSLIDYSSEVDQLNTWPETSIDTDSITSTEILNVYQDIQVNQINIKDQKMTKTVEDKVKPKVSKKRNYNQMLNTKPATPSSVKKHGIFNTR